MFQSSIPTAPSITDLEKIQGFFIMEDVAYVRKIKGPQGVEELQQLIPDLNLSKLSAIHRYPLAQELEVLRGMTIVLYGGDNPENWFHLGKHDFETVANSSLGKIILSLIGPEFNQLIKQGGRIMAAFAPFITYHCEIVDENNALITYENDPYPKEYYLGALTAIKDISHYPVTITTQEPEPKRHIYHIKHIN